MRDVFVRIERKVRVQPGVVRVEDAVVFLPRAFRVVAQALDIRGAYLHEGAELFVEQRSERARIVGAQRIVRIDRDAGMTRKHHLADGGEETAVRSIVIREQRAASIERLDDAEELPER